jgi:copper chaperone NosL
LDSKGGDMNRRELFKFLAMSFLSLFFTFKSLSFAEKLGIEHPINNPPDYTDKKRCDNCGMDRNKWARTRHEFQNPEGRFHTCSIHCLAVLSKKMKEDAKNVKVADYFHPDRMINADAAVYVIGSAVPGTMTKTSKIAFSSKKEAEKFVAESGGTISGFEGALSEARKEIQHQRMKSHH